MKIKLVAVILVVFVPIVIALSYETCACGENKQAIWRYFMRGITESLIKKIENLYDGSNYNI